MMRFTLFILTTISILGCVNLDGFVHNPVHCSTVSEATCEGKSDVWDQVCLSCEESYNFSDTYEFKDGWYARDIPDSSVTNHTLKTADDEGEIDLYWINSHGENSLLAQTTMIYNHGNYAGIEHYMPNVRYFYEAGYNVVVWDYRGYGKSMPETTANATQWFADTELVYDFVRASAIDKSKIVMLGQSLGAIPASHAVLYQKPCALIMETPFTSLGAIGADNSGLALPDAFLSSGAYNNIEKMKSYDGPLFVMHGTHDYTISYDAAVELYNAGAGPKDMWTIVNVGHIISRPNREYAVGTERYLGRMQEFLMEYATDCLTQ